MTTSQRLPKETEQEREIATILLDDNAVSINTENPYVFSSGIVSPIYCDLRLLMGAPEHRERIVEILAERMWGRYPDDNLDVVAGVATAGIPWAAWIAARLGKPLAYVRDAAKGHGKGQQVEGGVSSGQTAVILEDLTSSGGSALNSVEALRAMGCGWIAASAYLPTGFLRPWRPTGRQRSRWYHCAGSQPCWRSPRRQTVSRQTRSVRYGSGWTRDLWWPASLTGWTPSVLSGQTARKKPGVGLCPPAVS